MGKGNIPDFVPFYIDFFNKPEIRRLRRWSGTDNGKDKGKGVLVYQHIMFACFNQGGYYCEENQDLYDDIAEDWGLSVNTIRLIVEYLVKQSLLVRKSLNQVKVFTSEEIQENWMYSMKGRAQKRVARGNGPIILKEGIWIAENAYPQYFSLGQPFLEKSQTNDNKSKTNKKKSGTKNTRVEEEKTEEIRIDKRRREELVEEFGLPAVQYYENRVTSYYHTPTADTNLVFQWIIKDKAHNSGFFSTRTRRQGHHHNFEERNYNFNKLEEDYIKKINS